ncbi:MAG TPA: SLC13 family permease [Bacilli bacterium]|nr:SLC13 family permease [Bacilli bacterium]
MWHLLSIPAWETLAILAAVLLMLVSNKVRIDLIGVFLLLALGVLGLADEKHLFDGFASKAVVVIACMLALGEGLVRSGVTDWLALWIARFGGKSERKLLFLLMLVAGVFSSFISDIVVVAIFLPVVLNMERRLGIPASRLLMPLAIASMLGGLISMVGSSSNIVANQVLFSMEKTSLSLFSVAPVGLALLVAGVLYFALFGRWVLPKQKGTSATLKDEIGVHEYLFELKVNEESSWVGKKLRHIDFFAETGLKVVRVLRGKSAHFPRSDSILRERDVLLVQGHRDALLKLRCTPQFSLHRHIRQAHAQTGVAVAAEAIVRDDSHLVGQTIGDLRFPSRRRVAIVALWRNGRVVGKRLSDIRLRGGDMLLLQGAREPMQALREEEGLLVISQRAHVPRSRQKGPLALLILLGTLLAAGCGWLPLQQASLLGVALMVLTQILRVNEVYKAIEWPILLFVAAMIPLGEALRETGVIELVSQQLVDLFGHWGPYAVLAACFWLAALVTQILSNTATALLLTPVVIGAAHVLGVSPLPFVVAVIAAVSGSPITYVSHKVFLVVMGPGGYKYSDFVKVGLPLTLMFFALTMGLVPWLWPF